MVSPVVKLNVESELMPAYEAPAVSTMAPLSIKIWYAVWLSNVTEDSTVEEEVKE